ncbi:DUF1826 domain-containing protein [Paracoccus liaowanqingii]|nr:DUF1826 domain-containing protein [Paracoccus liaowanqingii]
MSTRSDPRPATAVNSAPDPRVLATLAMPGVAVALWHRRPDPAFQAWLDALPGCRLPQLRRVLRLRDASAALAAACDDRGLPPGPHRDALIDQIATLTDQAARHLGALLVTLRVEAGAGQSCPKWHLDAVRARLLCTLRGAGTQFGPATGEARVDHPQQMPTGAAALFRGRNWGNQPPGILHRSPPAQPGLTRLLVVVDPVDEVAA